jgi:hypothetical protein
LVTKNIRKRIIVPIQKAIEVNVPFTDRVFKIEVIDRNGEVQERFGLLEPKERIELLIKLLP